MSKRISLRPRLLKARDKFEEDFGGCTDQEKEAAIIVLRQFMEDVRVIQRAAEKRPVKLFGAGKARPRCSTCALEESTDSRKGFAPTAYGFLWAIYYSKPFFCHANHPLQLENIFDVSKLHLCAGFRFVISADPIGVDLAARVAMAAIKEILPESSAKKKRM